MKYLSTILSIGFFYSLVLLSDYSYPIVIETFPNNAEIRIFNRRGEVIHKGVSPEVVRVDQDSYSFARDIYSVEISKVGYHPYRQQVFRTMGSGFLGIIPFGKYLGQLFIRSNSQGIYELDRQDIKIALNKEFA